MLTTAVETLTTRQLAERLGVPEWHLHAALRRKLIDEPARHGPFRLWHVSDMDRVRAGLVAAGYLAAEGDQ